MNTASERESLTRKWANSIHRIDEEKEKVIDRQMTEGTEYCR